MTINKVMAQFKRELWENRVGFLWAPLVFSILLFVVAVWFTFNMHGVATDALRSGDEAVSAAQPAIAKVALTAPDAMASFTHGYQLFSSRLLMPIFMMVIFLYCHAALFSDRKSREVLFWRSMPVSETLNVLVKLAMVCLVVPMIVFIVSLTGAALFLMFLGVLNPDISSFWEALKALSVSFKLLGSSYVVMLLMLPLICWSLFASALARKSPAFISVVIPFGLWFLDFLLQRYLAINLFIRDGLEAYWHLALTTIIRIKGDSGTSIADVDLITSVDLKVTSVALLISVLLILATIWLRNNRYEI